MNRIEFVAGLGRLTVIIQKNISWVEESTEAYRLVIPVFNMVCGDRFSNIIIYFPNTTIDTNSDFCEYLNIRFSSCDDNLIIRSNKILPEDTIIEMDVSRDYV